MAGQYVTAYSQGAAGESAKFRAKPGPPGRHFNCLAIPLIATILIAAYARITGARGLFNAQADQVQTLQAIDYLLPDWPPA